MSVVLSLVIPFKLDAVFVLELAEGLRNIQCGQVEFVLVADNVPRDVYGAVSVATSEDKRFRLVPNAGTGLGSARNTGFEFSRGNFLWFVDADDFPSRDVVVYLASSLQSREVDLVHLKTVKGPREAGKQWFTKSIGSTAIGNKCFKARKNQPTQLGTSSSVCDLVFNRSLFPKSGFPIGRFFEDAPVRIAIVGGATSEAEMDCQAYFRTVRLGSIMGSRVSIQHLFDYGFSSGLVLTGLIKQRGKIELRQALNFFLRRQVFFLKLLRRFVQRKTVRGI